MTPAEELAYVERRAKELLGMCCTECTHALRYHRVLGYCVSRGCLCVEFVPEDEQLRMES